MELYLKYLHNAQFDPNLNLSNIHIDYKEKLDKLNVLKDTFYKNLTQEDKIKHNEIFDLQHELEDMMSAYTFSEGYKLASKINQEVYDYYRK